MCCQCATLSEVLIQPITKLEHCSIAIMKREGGTALSKFGFCDSGNFFFFFVGANQRIRETKKLGRVVIDYMWCCFVNKMINVPILH